ncbi:MAG: hypothetical protein EBR82_50225 [Caulobacteraceae bacterium]|nr:hypothetical protein [Caulobacteraceae bacterium]
MNKIEKLSTVPAAFSNIGEKVNELIDANPPLKAGAGITITDSEDSRLIALNLSTNSAYFATLLAASRTFYARATGGTSAAVTAGAINNVVYAGGNFTSLANGNKIYIDATVDSAGAVTALTVSKGSSVPSNTTTHAYTLLATVAVTSGQAVVTPVAWNYSQLQRCGAGGTTYYWGGFGA